MPVGRHEGSLPLSRNRWSHFQSAARCILLYSKETQTPGQCTRLKTNTPKFTRLSICTSSGAHRTSFRSEGSREENLPTFSMKQSLIENSTHQRADIEAMFEHNLKNLPDFPPKKAKFLYVETEDITVIALVLLIDLISDIFLFFVPSSRAFSFPAIPFNLAASTPFHSTIPFRNGRFYS